jgi:hypothetical protein
MFSDEEVVILGGFADGYLTQVQKLNILTGKTTVMVVSKIIRNS